jgi:hypothetical protein
MCHRNRTAAAGQVAAGVEGLADRRVSGVAAPLWSSRE